MIVMIDADLQNYPEDIPLLIKKLEAGADRLGTSGTADILREARSV